MLNYLKERFRDYMAMAAKEQKPNHKPVHGLEDPFVDFEVTHDTTGALITAFSMSKAEIESNFSRNLVDNLSDVLEVNKGNIHLLSKNDDEIVCEVNYSGGPGSAVKHIIKKIEEKEFEHIDYNDLDDDDIHPYINHSYGTQKWYCLRCGSLLLPIAKEDEWWGAWSWESMKQNGTLWFLCSNDKCCHSAGPLILHHPNSKSSPAAESYSLSWIR